MSSVADLSGMFKRVYGDLIEPLPSDDTIASRMSFVRQDYREGEAFHFPVTLSHEHGITFSNSNDAYALQQPESAIVRQANIEATSFVLRSRVSYDAASKALKGKSEKDRLRAFVNMSQFKVKSMMTSGELYRELQLMYGPGASATGSNIGVVNARVSGGGTGTQVINLSRASWIGGLWTNMINAYVDVYATGGTHRNPTTPIRVSAVDRGNCRLTLVGASAELDAVVATDLILPRSARTNSMAGIEMILRNTGSLFGIDAATYPVWQSSRYDVQGQKLNFDHVINGLGDLGEMGLDEGICLLISHRTFPDLLSDLASLRRYLGDKSKSIKQGAQSIYYETQTGPVEIKVHKFMKQGQAWGLPFSHWKRVGSSDLAFGVPGSSERFFLELPDNAGYEMRLYSRQGPICEQPAKSIEFHGIQNTGDSTPA